MLWRRAHQNFLACTFDERARRSVETRQSEQRRPEPVQLQVERGQPRSPVVRQGQG